MRIKIALLTLATLTTVCSSGLFADWPVLKTYSGDRLRRVKMPVGGIGTGTISVSGNGALVDWELCGRPGKGATPWEKMQPGFILRTEDAAGAKTLRLLQGPVDTARYDADTGAAWANAGFPVFTECAFKAAYPLGQVCLSDPDVPVTATLEAMNPLVKGNADASGIPAALLRWRLRNRTNRPLKASVCGVLGCVPVDAEKALVEGKNLTGVAFRSRELTTVDDRRGELLLAIDPSCGAVTRAIDIRDDAWSTGFNQFVRNFLATGSVANPVGSFWIQRNLAALAVSFEIPAKGEVALPFVAAWRFPHRRAWKMTGLTNQTGPFDAKEDVGNYYATKFASALVAAERFSAKLPALERKTVEFVREVLASPAPDVVKEAALFNVSTLRTETCFRTADGNFCCWEGCHDSFGSCEGNCTHVWGYEHCLVDLWPDLAKNMSETAFGPAMSDKGRISYRMAIPADLSKPGSAQSPSGHAAADGQMQCIVKACENWRKTGDDAWLKRLYPRIRLAMEFTWLPGGWDADRDGVMEGCQHNTMDVDYFGPNPQMQFLYFAALRAMAAMADAVGEKAFAAECRSLVTKGSAWTEANLFNGDYYEQQLRPAKGPFLEGTNTKSTANPEHPEYQLESGCLVDQLVGDFAARYVGLGAVADEAHAKRTLDTILERCDTDYGPRLYNPMRTFSFQGEKALRMAWFPPDRTPAKPFPYYMENMTGFEYIVAANLAQRGDFRRAEAVVRNIRDRYDGIKRNPFDEAECGRHYGRALAAWAVYRIWNKKGTGK